MTQTAATMISRARGLPLSRYLVAVAAVTAAVGIQLLFASVFGGHFRFMMLLPAVVFSAWYGGLGAGLLATGLTAAAAACLCLWLDPAGSFVIKNPEDLTALGLYMIVGGFISLLSHNLIQARRRLETSVGSVRSSEERFRTLFELANVGKAELDLTGRFVRVNRRLCELTGYRADELLGMGFIELTHPDDRDLATFRDLASGRINEYTSEERYCRKDCAVVWVQVAAALSRDANGQPRSSIAVVHDITDHKRAEHALEQRARHAALAADVGVALTGSDTARDMLQRCAAAMVKHLDAAFARIWTLDAGANVLELQASAGMYTHLDGPHSRIPMDKPVKIAVIAAERQPHLTNTVISDPHVSDQDWAKREGIVAFAGYPLVIEDRLVGVMAMFARAPLSPSALEALGSVAHEIAIGIERRRAETALRESEERFRAIFDSVNDAIFVHDLPTGAILDVNRRMCELYGWTREQARQLDVGALSSGEEPYTQERALEIISKAAAGTSQVFEWHAKDAAGHLFWVEVSLRHARIGNDDRMLITARDITERKRIEQALKDSQSRYRTLVRAIPGVVFTSGTDGLMRYISKQFYEYTGSPAGSAEGLGWTAALCPDDVEPVKAHWLACVRGQQPFETECRFRGKSGDYRWFIGRALPLRDEQHGLTEWVGCWFDIDRQKHAEEALEEANRHKRQLLATLQTANERLDRRVEERTAELAETNALLRREMAEHKAAEQARRESEIRFAEFMQHLPGIAFMKDVEGRYVWVNPTFEQIFHRPLEQYLGRTDDEVWPAAAAAQFRDHDRTVLRTYRTLQVTETFPHEDGLHHWLTTKFPILGDDGAPRLVAAVAIDITERMRTETQLRELQKLAQQRERLADIGAITAEIAHDLGNPLAGLSMQAQLVLHRVRRDERQPVSLVIRPLERILTEVQRLDGRIKGFMEFSREQRLKLNPVDLTRLLQEVVEIWRPVAAERGIVVIMENPPHGISLTADDEKLRRVFDNLVKNAIEAIDRGPGQVGVAISAPAPEAVCISVSDTGPGMPDTVEGFRLFETTKADGSGIGLAVVKQIVLAHYGTVEFSRRTPHGTVFRIELPRGGPGSAGAVPPRAATARSPRR
jgi:PAS domain S-box-containing protein